jgi:hypothetical protein
LFRIEFGIEFTAVVALLAAYFWLRRAEVTQGAYDGTDQN